MAATDIEESHVLTSKRILIDLKAALDGYSGIPQEARLLFSCLRSLPHDEFKVDGLIQTDSVRLHIPETKAERTYDQRIYQSARMIASFDHSIPENKWARYRYIWELRRYFSRLDKMAARGSSVTFSDFEGAAFADFIWRRLFEKTLDHFDRELVSDCDYKALGIPRSYFHTVAMRNFRKKEETRYLTLDTSGYDYLLAQSPFPAKVSPETKLLVRYHDAAPLLMTHTIENKQIHLDAHYQALKMNAATGAHFICVSDTTRRDLINILPEVESRAHVIHNIVSNHYFEEEAPAARIRETLKTRKSRAMREAESGEQETEDGSNAPIRYLLSVNTLEPRKNHIALIRAWEEIKRSMAARLKLVLVGGVGWDSDDILAAAEPWIREGQIIHLSNVPAAELRHLYRRAELVVCPSIFEGFGYAGVEAMRCGGVIAASDIPVHREIYQNAAAYFDPYDVVNIVQTLTPLIGAKASARAAREELRGEAHRVAAAYSRDKIRQDWIELFGELQKR